MSCHCRVSIVLGTSKTIKLYEVPNKVPKRFGFNEFSSDFAGQIAGTKKPAGLAPCGLLGLHRMTLVITDGEFWWSWRELNPRPKFLHPRYYMLSQSLHSPGTCGQTRHYQTSLIRFNASTRAGPPRDLFWV